MFGARETLGYPRRVRLAYHVMSAPAPLGLLFLARTERGLRYTGFMDRKSIRRMIAAREEDHPGAVWEASLLELKPMVDQLEAYFCGTRTDFDLPLDPVGSEFQMAVWGALCRIPYARTRSYGEIAKAVGQPKAARAVGLANHDNPIAIVIPCHRVIGADGRLTGYGGGLPRKRWLLQHEVRFGRMAEQLDFTTRLAVPTPHIAAKVAKPPTAFPRRALSTATRPARRGSTAQRPAASARGPARRGGR